MPGTRADSTGHDIARHSVTRTHARRGDGDEHEVESAPGSASNHRTPHHILTTHSTVCTTYVVRVTVVNVHAATDELVASERILDEDINHAENNDETQLYMWIQNTFKSIKTFLTSVTKYSFICTKFRLVIKSKTFFRKQNKWESSGSVVN